MIDLNKKFWKLLGTGLRYHMTMMRLTGVVLGMGRHGILPGDKADSFLFQIVGWYEESAHRSIYAELVKEYKRLSEREREVLRFVASRLNVRLWLDMEVFWIVFLTKLASRVLSRS